MASKITLGSNFNGAAFNGTGVTLGQGVAATKAYAIDDRFVTKEALNEKLENLKINLEDALIEGIAGLDRNKVYVIKVKGNFQPETMRKMQENLLAQFAAHNIAIIVMFIGNDGSAITINEKGEELEGVDAISVVNRLNYQLDQLRGESFESERRLTEALSALDAAKADLDHLRQITNYLYSEVETLREKDAKRGDSEHTEVEE